MDQADDVTFYLGKGMLESAEKGQHNFINLMSEVLQESGFHIHFHPDTGVARLMAETRPGYSIYHMKQPQHKRALTICRAYFYPFWHIEASAKRWEWDVALMRFDPRGVVRAEADHFYDRWQRKLFQQRPNDATRGDFIYVPLQGLIRQKRAFQWCSPIEMLERTAARFPNKRVLTTLDPEEDYTSADRMALAMAIGRHPRIEIVDRPAELCLQDCDFVVSMNSEAAFSAYFFGKPVVLYGEIDFHHIAGSVIRDGEDAAFSVIHKQPDYAGYVWWFLQIMAVNGGRDDAKDRIKFILRRHGWPI